MKSPIEIQIRVSQLEEELEDLMVKASEEKGFSSINDLKVEIRIKRALLNEYEWLTKK
ncbi:MAG: hypothetical protein AAF348_18755 [Bacteroidota bacterium]